MRLVNRCGHGLKSKRINNPRPQPRPVYDDFIAAEADLPMVMPRR
jgi:hypothetical protein